MNKISIEGLEIFAYHGVNPEEKKDGQPFYVDCEIESDIITPGCSDDLEDTINYAKVSKFINRFFTENSFDLIEAAAYRTAREIMVNFPLIKGIKLTVNKPNAPMKLKFSNVSVTAELRWTKAYIALGSNMGDREGYLNNALESMYDDDNIRVCAVSSFYETAPYGVEDQDNFVNGCVEIETIYSPSQLLDALHVIENENERERTLRWGPRTLDLDIIFFGDEVIRTQDLIVPHIDMENRLFVLEPLCEIAPYVVHPLYNATVKQLLDDLKGGCGGCGGCSSDDNEGCCMGDDMEGCCGRKNAK